jgi:flagellar biosynthesis/type III secretory pathway M-ring protein FliF/YscJ
VWSQKRTAELQLEVQRQAAQAQFEIKAAELAMNTDSPDVTRGKSLALAQLFPGRLPAGFAKQFDAQVFGVEETSSKKELIRLLAEKPQQRARIIKDWLQLFPEDQWANNLKE